MSKIGTATTVERIDKIGSGEQSPGLVFRVSSRLHYVCFFEGMLISLEAKLKSSGCPTFGVVSSRLKRVGSQAIQRLLRGAAFARTTEVQIDAQGITASGDLGGSHTGTLRLPWSRIAELHYAPGGVGQTGGLYAREGAWCSRCILPRLTEAQAEGVIAAIDAHYPAHTRENNVTSRTPLKAVRPQHLSPYRATWKPRWLTLSEHSR